VSVRAEVSVVVATRNRAHSLRNALESLAAQRCAARFEIVVVDNGSDDATAEVISEQIRRDARVRLAVEATVGLSHAKNAGLRAAQGELILFTDDDVVLGENWIAGYLEFFSAREGLVIAGGPVLPIPSDLSEWPSWVTPAARADLPSLFYGELERPLRPTEWLWGANMAARRQLLESLGSFREDFGRGAQPDTFEDVDLVDRLRQRGGEAWYCPGVPVWHRVPLDAAWPRQLLLTAFNRGCNDRVAANLGNYYEPALRVPVGRLGAALTLPWLLGTLTASMACFRLTRAVRLFDVARRSSWGAGWCMWSVLGESSRLRARVIRVLVLSARRLAFRLAPPSRPGQREGEA
jgi:GT2 family glycosyltransferase